MSNMNRKRKEVTFDQVAENKLVLKKDKGKRRMYEQETLSDGRRKSRKNQYLDKEDEPHSKIKESITVWDIPHHMTRSQVFYTIRYLGYVKSDYF